MILVLQLAQRYGNVRTLGKLSHSGVTRVDVTRCGNWWCHPVFVPKNWRPF